MRLVSDCHEAVDAGAWVLGVLDADEAEAFSAHLAGCERCRAEVAELQHVVDVLPMAAEQRDPSPQLRSRVLDVVRHEAPQIAARNAGDELARRRGLRRLSSVRPAAAAAVAAASLLAGVVAGVALDGGGSSGTRTVGASTRTLAATVDVSAAPDATASLVVSGGHGRLHMTRLPRPPRGRVYQVWVQRPGHDPQATDALFSVRRGGSATVDVPLRLQERDLVLVTAEPDGGSRVPTTLPILTARPA